MRENVLVFCRQHFIILNLERMLRFVFTKHYGTTSVPEPRNQSPGTVPTDVLLSLNTQVHYGAVHQMGHSSLSGDQDQLLTVGSKVTPSCY